ncbi:M23 family metallopeptidase [Fonticella tunisiensis]|uniref:Murein DD-endopeptidase MepM/ murein hydrolase activator NlpD n=1 Tax=Fonticella tunisiensis TaxID=1096341 RepID=A0A4R7KT52_9CLOT|nr:M23 family metallopeptidase [Fonticella tunisiensis]TDT61282.1 murein DD-endopeptidase MepM/ murein hydrolase activator NlpD [Fonticella tunisiensis]
MKSVKKVVLISAILAAVTALAFAISSSKKTSEVYLNSQMLALIPQPKTELELGSKEESTQNQKSKKAEIIRYTVKSGDTLEAIAKRYGISVDSIAESNLIDKNDIIKVGQELKFPSINGVVYKIKKGDALWDIASRYKIKLEDIARINSITSLNDVKFGKEIILPGEAKLLASEVQNRDTSVRTATSRGSASTKSALSNAAYAGIIWPLSGRFTSAFGQRWGEFHKGIDLAAPVGTTVSAALSGKVVFSGYRGTYGRLIIVDHGNGMETYYAHLSKSLVSVGQNVKRGQAIAKVGATGRVTGPHLHFEIRFNSVPVNPLSYLR